jgi:hypothetical protein
VLDVRHDLPDTAFLQDGSYRNLPPESSPTVRDQFKKLCVIDLSVEFY